MNTTNSGGARSPAKLAHFVVRTSRYDETVAWYQKVLGARVAFANPMLSFLTYDDEHHRVAVLNVPSLETPGFVAGVDHVAFTFATLDDLLHTWRRLRDDGIEPYWCINHGPTTSLYYRDPNGVQVELQIDNFASDEELLTWMRGGSFRRNPIGVEFDPEELARRLAAGDPLSELVQQGSAPRAS